MQHEHLEVLIIGAGISGIGAGYHVQSRCPNQRYAILEARERLGGTWDLFQYPGIRSDSDMYTLGFSFRPWTNPKAIADGASIMEYLRETAEMYGIDKKIRYGHKVKRASWSSADSRWTVLVEEVASGKTLTITCDFIYACAGYYNYDQGYQPQWEGMESFQGRLIHPQKWPVDVNYDNQRVVVIGSGATAVTLVPAMAKQAAHVTMLQRSPSYVLSVPERDLVANWLRDKVSEKTAYSITRWKNVLLGMAFFNYSRKFPEHAKRLLLKLVRKELGEDYDTAHFTPPYNPWDQRMCLVPDGDLFDSLRAGTSSVVTDHIERFTEKGLQLRSGKHLDADLIVSATGLRLQFLGGMVLEVDGVVVDVSKTMAYRGMMCSDVPNLALAIGYTNASWTLKADLTSEYVCRLLNYMDEKGYAECCPRRSDPRVKELPMLDFSSGYVRRSIDQFPRQGSLTPWRVHQNYALDIMDLRHSALEDGVLQFTGTRGRTARGAATQTASDARA